MFVPLGSADFFAKPGAGGSPKGRIFIIDDRANDMTFLRIGLERAGYHSVLTPDLARFSEAFSVAGCTAVVVDVHLGSTDATDVLDVLRGRNVRVPVILISGDTPALKSAQKYAAAIGLSDILALPKPFTTRQLLDMVESGHPSQTVLADMDFDEALREGWLYPVFQPQLDLKTGKIASAELLSRLAHPAFGIIRPEQFIESLSSAKAEKLFWSHVQTACRLRPKLAKLAGHFRIAINVDPKTVISTGEALRRAASTDPEFWTSVMIEVTEEGVGRMSDAELKSLYKLSIAGAQLSIDDFGSGSSNFARLSTLPFSEIKIDRSIVSGSETSHTKQVLIRTIVGMAHQLGARAIAEGVESADQYSLLSDCGCDAIQGFMIARPMKFKELEIFVSEFNNRKKSDFLPQRM